MNGIKQGNLFIGRLLICNLLIVLLATVSPAAQDKTQSGLWESRYLDTYLLYDQKRYDEAEKRCRIFLDSGRDGERYGDIYYGREAYLKLLGDILVARGKYDEALECYGSISKEWTGYAGVRLSLAKVYLRKGSYDKAEELCRTYVEIWDKGDPYSASHPDFRRSGWSSWHDGIALLGDIMFAQGKYNEAISFYDQLSDPKKGHRVRWARVAYSFFRTGRIKDAVRTVYGYFSDKYVAMRNILISFFLLALAGLLSYFIRVWLEWKESPKEFRTHKWEALALSIIFVSEMFFNTRIMINCSFGAIVLGEIFFIALSAKYIIAFFLFRLNNWARIAFFIYVLISCLWELVFYSDRWIQLPVILYYILAIFILTRARVREMYG